MRLLPENGLGDPSTVGAVVCCHFTCIQMSS